VALPGSGIKCIYDSLEMIFGMRSPYKKPSWIYTKEFQHIDNVGKKKDPFTGNRICKGIHYVREKAY
jgi:hypothetical protein